MWDKNEETFLITLYLLLFEFCIKNVYLHFYFNIYYKGEGVEDPCGPPIEMDRVGGSLIGEINVSIFPPVSMGSRGRKCTSRCCHNISPSGDGDGRFWVLLEQSWLFWEIVGFLTPWVRNSNTCWLSIYLSVSTGLGACCRASPGVLFSLSFLMIFPWGQVSSAVI